MRPLTTQDIKATQAASQRPTSLRELAQGLFLFLAWLFVVSAVVTVAFVLIFALGS